ncbi:MAG TPA: deoxyribose-phosphate aldolase [Caldilineae bacterium]|nr:deoxyribose-phosphate aldolase [Caldilineae bacterium]
MPDIAETAPEAVAGMIDHTLLKPDATAQQVAALCEEGERYRFAAVCVHPTWVSQCVHALSGSPVKVASVVGFPLGMTTPEVKAYEAKVLLSCGATELDMVLNIGALKSGNFCLVWNDIHSVAEVVHERGARLKVILETGYLSDEEKVAACIIARVAGADFVKTCTGFGPGGATEADVRLMRRTVGGSMGVKAAGGIRTFEQARRMVLAGANRIGTSSGVHIVEEARQQANALSPCQ